MEISPGRAPVYDDDDKPLRKPHSVAETKKKTTSTPTPPKSPSRLSPTAQEFIPKSSQSGNSGYSLTVNPQPHLVIPPSSVQNRLLRHQHPNQYAAALNCNSYQQPTVSLITSSVQNRLNINDKPTSDLNSNYLQPTEVETIALEYLATVIQCLNDNPGSFDTIATRFLTIFEGMENNEYVLSNAMEDIFNESIENSNFRYMGAKLYNLLHSQNLSDSLFDTLLKCKLDYHQAEVIKFMQNNSDQKVRETALFLAELYMQLRGDDSRTKLIAENIVFCLKQLLTKDTADNIRCICLTLKLAGYDLDSDCPNDVSLVMQQLDIVNKTRPGKYPLVQNVISLKKNNWGRTVSHEHVTVSRSTSESSCQASTTEPTFYGPDGKVLTDEESRFLATVPKTESSTDDEFDLDPEMDEEAEKEYRKFAEDNDESTDELDPEMDEEAKKEYRKFCKLSN